MLGEGRLALIRECREDFRVMGEEKAGDKWLDKIVSSVH